MFLILIGSHHKREIILQQFPVHEVVLVLLRKMCNFCQKTKTLSLQRTVHANNHLSKKKVQAILPA